MLDLLSKQEKLRSIVTPQEQPMMRTGGNLPKYDGKTPTLGNTSFLNFNPKTFFNPWQPKELDYKTLRQNYYRDNSTTWTPPKYNFNPAIFTFNPLGQGQDFGIKGSNNWSMQSPKQNTNPDFSINTEMLPFDQYAFGYNKFPNTWQPKGLDHKTLMQNYYRDNPTTKFSTPLDGSTLPPLVKPIADTAAMDEFVKQVEMDYDADIDSFKRTLELWNKYPKAANWKAPKVNPGSIQKMQKALGITTKNSNVNSNSQLYQGMNWAQTGLAAAGPVLGGITGLILNNKRKAPVNLKLSRMTPQQINLERERAAARESAGVATSNLTRSLRNAAPTAGSYMSNVVAGITDIDRNLSNALGESYTQEELQNAQLRQQAEAANLDIDMQEQMYNSQLQNQFDASKEAARNAYINQIVNGISGGLSQKFQSEQNANYLNMLNPDYVYYGTGKRLRYKPYIAPRRRSKNS
jgi:hypothetical protein